MTDYLEYNTVIFVGLEDSAFWKFLQQKEEETCAFFVAYSRAKQKVVFTFTNIRNRKINARKNIQNLYDVLLSSGLVDEIDFSQD